jgi:hypothetical protein
MITFKPPAADGWRVPYEDFYARWVVPDLIAKKLRLEVRPSFTKESALLYYGIGNAAPAPETGPFGQPASDYFQYARVHPTMLVRIRLSVGGGFYLLLGNALTYNRIDVHPGSKLEADEVSTDPRIRRFFGPLGPHFVDLFEYGLAYDTRDDETATHAGMYHQMGVRLSPGGTELFPYRYEQANVTVRFYLTPVERWLTLALRVVGDAQLGNPPFYELARFDETFAIGGGKGVRGVPAQRYYGKIKLFGNLEARSQLFSFGGEKKYAIGAAAFVDAGRLWSGWGGDPALDGNDGLGLKYGVGGGLRFQQGSAFVVRGDLAWSPDARPIGGYFSAGQIF